MLIRAEKQYVKHYIRHQLWNLQGTAVQPDESRVEKYTGSMPLELLMHRISMLPVTQRSSDTHVTFRGTILRARDLGLPLGCGDLVIHHNSCEFVLDAELCLHTRPAYVHARYSNIYRTQITPEGVKFWSNLPLDADVVRKAINVHA